MDYSGPEAELEEKIKEGRDNTTGGTADTEGDESKTDAITIYNRSTSFHRISFA